MIIEEKEAEIQALSLNLERLNGSLDTLSKKTSILSLDTSSKKTSSLLINKTSWSYKSSKKIGKGQVDLH